MDQDVEGENSVVSHIDAKHTNFGKYNACQRVARTLFLGSAPITQAANRGLEERRITLGCAMPGEPVAVFDDALNALVDATTYLYQKDSRYWYDTQPTVTKLAEDRAKQFERDTDRVEREIEEYVREDLHDRGAFGRVHPFPKGSGEVPDDVDGGVRLVVLGLEYGYRKGGQSKAEAEAHAIWDVCGSRPRQYRNMLVFLAADASSRSQLQEAACRLLAWESILKEHKVLNLAPDQVDLAESRRDRTLETLRSRIPETYRWILLPVQHTPASPITWEAIRLRGQGALAARVTKRLIRDEQLVPSFGSTRLRMDLDRIPLWRGDHVSVQQVVEYYAQYLYLSRMCGPKVLLDTISSGVALFSWETDTFALAESYDEASGRYRGIRYGERVSIPDWRSKLLIVKPEAARKQIDLGPINGDGGSGDGPDPDPDPPVSSTRYWGKVTLDKVRMGRDATEIADEVLMHFDTLPEAEVTVTLEINVVVKGAIPDDIKRTVSENGQSLKFEEQEFVETE